MSQRTIHALHFGLVRGEQSIDAIVRPVEDRPTVAVPTFGPD